MITDEKWYWICASQTEVEGLEVGKRRCVLPHEREKQLAPGRTAQTGKLKDKIEKNMMILGAFEC